MHHAAGLNRVMEESTTKLFTCSTLTLVGQRHSGPSVRPSVSKLSQDWIISFF